MNTKSDLSNSFQKLTTQSSSMAPPPGFNKSSENPEERKKPAPGFNSKSEILNSVHPDFSCLNGDNFPVISSQNGYSFVAPPNASTRNQVLLLL